MRGGGCSLARRRNRYNWSAYLADITHARRRRASSSSGVGRPVERRGCGTPDCSRGGGSPPEAAALGRSRGARPSRGIEQERDHGAPDHSLSAPSTTDCTAGPRGGSRPKSSPPLLITLRRPQLPLRYHFSRSFGDDAQRIATRSATDHDPPRPPLTRNASASFQTRPIPNRAHQPLGRSAGRSPHWPRHQHARGGLPQSTGRRPTNPRQAQSELLCSL